MPIENLDVLKPSLGELIHFQDDDRLPLCGADNEPSTYHTSTNETDVNCAACLDLMETQSAG
jgi:hypothetical protein